MMRLKCLIVLFSCYLTHLCSVPVSLSCFLFSICLIFYVVSLLHFNFTIRISTNPAYLQVTVYNFMECKKLPLITSRFPPPHSLSALIVFYECCKSIIYCCCFNQWTFNMHFNQEIYMYSFWCYKFLLTDPHFHLLSFPFRLKEHFAFEHFL